MDYKNEYNRWLESSVVDTAFRYSDHNPVYLEFVLEP